MNEYIFFIIYLYDYFFVYYLFTINITYLILLVLATITMLNQKQKNKYSDKVDIILSEKPPPLSLLVPCYNEEISIVETINALTNLEYSEYEIIIINDGSIDNTLQVLIENFKLVEITPIYDMKIETAELKKIFISPRFHNITVIDKVNGGKSDALNTGLNISKYHLFVAIDADTIIDKSSLLTITKPFVEDYKNTACAGGTVMIINGCTVNKGSIEKVTLPKSTLAKFQIIEYFSAFICGRLGFSYLNALLIISGAFGIFKKDIAIKVNGYSLDTVGEDMDLVIKIHKYIKKSNIDNRIVFLSEPVCWTMCPEDFKSFFNQRKRWIWGLLDNLISNKDMFMNYKYGSLSFISYNYYVFFEALEPIISTFGLLTLLITLIFYSADAYVIFSLLGLSILFGIFVTIFSVIITENINERYSKVSDYIKLVGYCVLQNIGYRQIGSIIRFIAILKYKYKGNNWGKQKRIKFKG